jgi:diguanylate cyclase (GGDEF)-like protein/PAS domain S-box-containing protein
MEQILQLTESNEFQDIAMHIIESTDYIIIISESQSSDNFSPKIIYVNDAFVRETGYVKKEVIGKTPRILQGPKTNKAIIDKINIAIKAKQSIRAEILNYKKNGDEFWQELNIFPLRRNVNETVRFASIQRNITPIKINENSILEAKNSLELATKAGGIGVWDWDIVNDVLNWDQGMYSLYGINSRDCHSEYDSWRLVVHPDDRQMADSKVIEAIKSGALNTEFRVIWPDTSVRHIRAHALVIKNSSGQATRMVGTNWDITDTHMDRERIEAASLIDSLTNLPNRRLFIDRLQQALLIGQRSNTYGALFFIDIDQFKFINDKFGHLGGDWLLVELAKRIKGCLRKSDTIARYAGDEFVVLLSELNKPIEETYQEMHKLGENIRSSIAKPYSIPHWTDRMEKCFSIINPTVSIGIKIFDDSMSDWEGIIAQADSSMYAAKRSGGNAVQFSILPNEICTDRFLHESEEVLRLQNQIFTNQDETIELLISLASAHNSETGSHLLRTQKYIFTLATRLIAMGYYSEELNKLTIENLCRAAPLHDIGKIAIPDSILNKKSKLSHDEWQIMKTHTQIGSNILISSKSKSVYQNRVFEIASDMAGCHHEKWDGTGYPAMLSGKSIPLAARIMSIVDTYDALVSVRPYKEAWTHEDALQEIIENTGKSFDPAIIEAFVLESEIFKSIANEYRDL